MRASVVIPALDSQETIERAVRSLKDQDPALDVLVVDDGSRDETGARAAASGARVLRLPERGGPARARNRGVAATSGEVVVFTDADCAALPGFVASLLAPLERDPTVTGTKGAYVTAQRSLTARFVQLEYEQRYARMAARREIDFIDTYACAYRREALLAVGGFDERYDRPSTEDQELAFRLHARGARFLFVPEARTEHIHADTPGAYVRKKAKIGYYKAATLRAHPAKAVDDAHTPLSVKVQLLLAPLVLLALGGAALVLGLELLVAVRSDALSWVGPSLALDARAPAALGALVVVLAFLASTLPLTLSAVRRDPALALLVPAFALARGLGLGWGLLRGSLRELAGGGVLLPRPELPC